MDSIAKLTPTGTELLKNGKAHAGKRGRPRTKPSNFVQLTHSIIPEKPATQQAQIAQIEQPKQPLKIALIGTAPSSRDLAPFNDPSWTIWACSPGNAHGTLPRVDTWFEIHSNLMWPECVSYGAPYVEWLKQQKFPIYMQDQRLVPNATPLPIQELVNEFGKYFFTSSFAYMLAMAIKAGADEISLFGIDMASKDEYILQRPGGHYFMQEAAKRGIKVNVPFESDLAQHPPLYGYDSSTPFGRKLHVRKVEIQNRVAGMEAELAKLNHSIAYLKGALEDLDYVSSIFGGLQT
jgi:hypothetical protein